MRPNGSLDDFLHNCSAAWDLHRVGSKGVFSHNRLSVYGRTAALSRWNAAALAPSLARSAHLPTTAAL